MGNKNADCDVCNNYCAGSMDTGTLWIWDGK